MSRHRQTRRYSRESQIQALRKRLRATRAAYIAECEAHQETVNTALGDHAASYVENKGLGAMYGAKLFEQAAIKAALVLASEEKQLTAVELTHKRMREYRDMQAFLAKLEQPVVDMTPGGSFRSPSAQGAERDGGPHGAQGRTMKANGSGVLPARKARVTGPTRR